MKFGTLCQTLSAPTALPPEELIMPYLDPPLRPRNGRTLRVLNVNRISTEHQDARSNDDQQSYCRDFVMGHYDGPLAWQTLSGRGSGEYLDRDELRQAEALVESGAVDLVIVEDLARICRRSRAFDFCELCEDNGCRLIAINDHIDTGKDDWRLNASFATIRHEMYNADTAKRIRRTLRNRFEHGGVVTTFPYGYIKLPGAKSDADVRKDPAAVPIYDHIFQMLEDGASYGEVADWLNSKGVPTGQWTRSKRWTGPMVARVVHNPILKGYRRRNERVSRRVNKTGRRKSIKADPSELLMRHVPHLEFIDPERYDRVIALLDRRNAGCGRASRTGVDPRAGVPKRRTAWPGQHVRCCGCGRGYVWGGHGKSTTLMCSGARGHFCWNGATFDGRLAAKRLAAALLRLARELPEFDDELLGRIRDRVAEEQSQREESLRRLAHEIQGVESAIGKILEAIETSEFSPALRTRLGELEAKKATLEAERDRLQRQPVEAVELPTRDEIVRMVEAAVGRLAGGEPEFGRAMRRLISRLEVFPVQLLDGGQIVLRARMTVDLTSLFPGPFAAAAALFTRTVVVDLFDPPQRAALMARVVELRASGLTEREVARQLGITHTAAQRAAALYRKMTQLGLTDPYVPVTAPPDNVSKFRRHLHPRYQFRPLPGYPAWPDAEAA